MNWTRLDYPGMEGGTAEWEAQGVGLCSVLPVTGGYKMWYSGLAGSTDTISIGYAVSTDGITWQRDTVHNPILRPGTAGQWDDFNIFAPRVIILDNIYYMYYGAARETFGQYRVGLATSTDGIDWDKYWDSPVLRPSPSGWDNGEVETACVIKIGNTLKLWYDGSNSGTYHWQIGLATTSLSFIDTLYVPTEYATIQEAINAAVDGNLLLVDEGTYLENINFKGKAITVASRFFIDGDESHIENTIIDGSQPADPDSASVVTFRSGEDTTSIICGFTIRGGTGTSVLHEAMIKRLGGGVFIYFSDANIRNNIIELNHIEHVTDSWGGGIAAYTENSNHYIIENNIIQDNTITTPIVAGYSLGGGIYTGTFGYVRIVNNKVLDNTITASTAYGGGILPANFGGGSYFILGNVISGNNIYASTGGSGGIDIYNHSPVIKNNLIVNNAAPLGGGAIIENSSPIFTNNTIAYNTATISGGGLEIVSPVPEIMNSILWGNSAQIGSQINGTADVSYSDIEGGYSGTGNLNIDPLFRDAANGDFHLQSTDCGYGLNSPCIDAGDPTYEDWPLSCDWGLGQVRSDMGAFGGTNLLVDVPEEDVELPSDYVLYQNYPNPFNSTTTFRYSIPTQSKVVIKVYDILGNEIALLIDEEKTVGTYELTWNATNLSSGIYFYQLRAVNPSTGSGQVFVNTKKMILLK